jgi:uncharacterized membrane protein HdeD (DUF308 family)
VLGLLSIALAVILVVDPGAGALAVTWAIGWYGVFFGITLLVLAQRLRRLQTDEHLWRRVQAGPPTAA